jgi:iron(III) transport system ATP-binding protein
MLYDESSPRKAVVVKRAFRGAQFLYTVRLASGTEVLCLVPSHHRHAIGEQIGVRLQADHLVVFPRERAPTELPPPTPDRPQVQDSTIAADVPLADIYDAEPQR